jgi:hypothetical protein
MPIRTSSTEGSGPTSTPLSKFARLRIGDRVRRPAWGTGIIEAFEADPEEGVLVVVRHPRTRWRCKPGELVFLRREDTDTLTHYVHIKTTEKPDGVEAHHQASSSENGPLSPRSSMQLRYVDVITQQDVPSTALVPYSASEKTK